MEAWTRRHVSDHSSFHYLHFILETQLSNIATQDDWKIFLLQMVRQFCFSTFLIVFFPGHESLWLYRRSLWNLLLLTTEHECRTEPDQELFVALEQTVELCTVEFKLHEDCK
jgi:hypothetical protein